MLIHAALRCTEDKFSADLWPMEMYYAVWFYNRVPNMNSVLSAIEICPRSRFEPVSETLGRFHVWGFPKYYLEPKLQNHGVNITKWFPMS